MEKVKLCGNVSNHFRRGINFTPTQSEVEIIYSTQTCHDFYRIRGSEKEQNCNYPMEAISTIEAVNCILE